MLGILLHFLLLMRLSTLILVLVSLDRFLWMSHDLRTEAGIWSRIDGIDGNVSVLWFWDANRLCGISSVAFLFLRWNEAEVPA